MKAKRWRKKAKIGAVLLVLLLLVGVVAATHPDYVPDSGYYHISKSYAYSDFVWNEHGFNEWYPEAYEHEFRVRNTGFAKYAGYWSSNLPQKYLDLEDDAQNSVNTWDEFVVGSDDAEATIAGREYWMYIDLSNQDSSVTSSRTILEAELCWDAPGSGLNWPMDWYTIDDFTAPASGYWDFTSRSASTSNPEIQVNGAAEGSEKDYISRRKELLRRLSTEMPGKVMPAMVSFSSYYSASDVDILLQDYMVKTRAAWFESPRYGFGGGFVIEGSTAESLAREIGDLKEDMAGTKEALQSADPREKTALIKVISKQEMMVQALSEGDARIYGVEIEGTLQELQRLQEDPKVSLVDVKYYPDAPKGTEIVQRPIEPEG